MADFARRVRLTGRVQGVFLRAWTQDQARELGVNGWVRNCPDGSVDAHLEGGEAAVTALVDRLREGPPSAEVDEVVIEEAAAEGFDRFQVRH